MRYASGELGRQTADFQRKSEELNELAKESVHQAATMIRGETQPAVEPAAAQPSAAPAPLEPGSESDKPI
jgi:hypothetical protein